MTEVENNSTISRRDFIQRALKAGVSITVASSLGFWLTHRGKSIIPDAGAEVVTLPDFSIPDLAGKMAIVHGPDRVTTVNRALNALGGIEKFVKNGDRVLIKVNAAFASPPALSATVNPDLLAEVVRLCLAAGASSVLVTDNPINDPESCFNLSGIADAVRQNGAKLILPRDNYFQPTTVPGGELIKEWPLLYKPFSKVDKLIGITPVKDHARSGASMTMKNWYGLLGGRRNTFHQDIHNIIKELAMMVQPTFVILDGTMTMMTNGPTGGSLSDLKQTNTMIVSTDHVAADAFGATLLEKTVADLPFISKASAAGAGNADYKKLNPITINES